MRMQCRCVSHGRQMDGGSLPAIYKTKPIIAISQRPAFRRSPLAVFIRDTRPNSIHQPFGRHKISQRTAAGADAAPLIEREVNHDYSGSRQFRR